MHSKKIAIFRQALLIFVALLLCLQNVTGAQAKSKKTENKNSKSVTTLVDDAKQEDSSAVPDKEDKDTASVDAAAPTNSPASDLVVPTPPVETKLEDSVIDATLPGGPFPVKTGFIQQQDGTLTPTPVSGVQPDLGQKNVPHQVPINGIQNGTSLAPVPAPSTTTAGVTDVSFSRIILSTFMVILAIAVMALIWKFLQSRNFSLGDKSGQLRVIAQHPISLRSKLMIVEALGRKFLVGATQDHIQLVSDLEIFEGSDNQRGFAQTMSAAAEDSHLQTVAPLKAKASIFMPVEEAMLQAHVPETASASVSPTVTSVAERIRNSLRHKKKLG